MFKCDGTSYSADWQVFRSAMLIWQRQKPLSNLLRCWASVSWDQKRQLCKFHWLTNGVILCSWTRICLRISWNCGWVLGLCWVSFKTDIQVTVFLTVTPCSDTTGYQCFGRPYWLHLQGVKTHKTTICTCSCREERSVLHEMLAAFNKTGTYHHKTLPKQMKRPIWTTSKKFVSKSSVCRIMMTIFRETIRSSKVVASYHITTRCHKPKDHAMDLHKGKDKGKAVPVL
jgi:hypothetical protein